jgi:S-adenosylmethionine synthetase
MGFLFTSESVSEGHPDKVADQISDAILDEFLRQDEDAKVACETLVTTGLTVISGEVRSSGYVDVQNVARRVINRIGYTKAEYMFDGNSCGVISAIHEQSPDINQGVVRQKTEEQGAGDQGLMFGYACDETDELMPLSLVLSQLLMHELSVIRRENKTMKYLRPDSKSQLTIEYGSDGKPEKVHTVVISTQHDEFDEEKAMQKKIRDDVINILIPRVKKRLPEQVQKIIGDGFILHVNPTGKFVIGGPHGDTGLTGRKIIVDTYGGAGRHGGGAFSGKDPSKVDRSAAYAARYVAKNIVAAGLAKKCEIQLSYAIGVAEPVSIYLNTFGTSKIDEQKIIQKIKEIVSFAPREIIKQLDLLKPIYSITAAYGHFGRRPSPDGRFSWEQTNLATELKKLL